MRKSTHQIDAYRVQDLARFPRTNPGDLHGLFVVPVPTGILHVLSSGNRFSAADRAEGLDAWEHVSVSLTDRCPTWDEMSFVKDLFWGPDELVIQLHVPRADHINFHPYVLHLWKYTKGKIPLPPTVAVGPTRDQRRRAFAGRIWDQVSRGGL